MCGLVLTDVYQRTKFERTYCNVVDIFEVDNIAILKSGLHISH